MTRYVSIHGKIPLEVVGVVYDGTEASAVEVSKMVGPLWKVEQTEDEGSPSIVISHCFGEFLDQIARAGEYVFKSELGVYTRSPTVFESAFRKKD